MAPSDSQSKVLSTPELLAGIFAFAEPQTNSANARVCKGWKDEALASLYHTLERLSVLLYLLGPMELDESTNEPSFHFTRQCPTPADWKRFISYSSRIRVLSCGKSDYGDDCSPFLKNILPVLASKTDLFPNLHSLTFGPRSPHQYLALFLQPNLKFLKLDCKPTSWREITINTLPSLAPSLVVLEFGGMVNYFSESTRTLTEIFSKKVFVRLAELRIPVRTHSLLHGIASLPELQTLSLFAGGFSTSLIEPDGNPSSTCSYTSFVSLTNLNVCLDHHSIITFLGQFELPKLDQLCIFSMIEDRNSIEPLFAALATQGFRRLRTLIIISSSVSPQSLDERVDCIQYISCCKDLEILQISDMPIRINADLVLSLVKALPALESLKLMCSTYDIGVDISALVGMIPYCQNLKDLALNGQVTSELPEDHTAQKFTSLESFAIVASPVPDREEVVKYLRGLLPALCQFQMFPSQ